MIPAAVVKGYAPLGLTSLLGAAVMAAVMASDSQILALLGLLPVVPMTLGSALLLIIVSLCTPASRPADATLARYF